MERNKDAQHTPTVVRMRHTGVRRWREEGIGLTTTGWSHGVHTEGLRSRAHDSCHLLCAFHYVAGDVERCSEDCCEHFCLLIDGTHGGSAVDVTAGGMAIFVPTASFPH